MEHVKVVSNTYPPGQIEEMLKTPGVLFDDVHILYPSDEKDLHFTRFFSIEPILADTQYRLWIVDDMFHWVKKEGIECDVVLAPNQPGVNVLADELADEMGSRLALWEYQKIGRFGDRFVSRHGYNILPGERVLVFNGVTQQGKCVGQRLPSFAELFMGEVVAACVFAKGTTGDITATEKKYGSKFYSAIQVDIPIFTPGECPRCAEGDKALAWTEVVG